MNEDFLDLLSALLAAEARFLVVGAFNASRVFQALNDFGAPLNELKSTDFEQLGTAFKMSVPPRRIDILTRAAGRPQDVADAVVLERIRAARPAGS